MKRAGIGTESRFKSEPVPILDSAFPLITSCPVLPWPGIIAPLSFRRPRAVAALRAAMKARGPVLLFPGPRRGLRPGTRGVSCQILAAHQIPGGGLRVLGEGKSLRVLESGAQGPRALWGRAKKLSLGGRVSAAALERLSRLVESAVDRGILEEEVEHLGGISDGPESFCYLVAAQMRLSPAQIKAVLDCESRADLVRVSVWILEAGQPHTGDRPPLRPSFRTSGYGGPSP